MRRTQSVVTLFEFVQRFESEVEVVVVVQGDFCVLDVAALLGVQGIASGVHEFAHFGNVIGG